MRQRVSNIVIISSGSEGTASAVVELYDATGEPSGVGPAQNTTSVFLGRTDLAVGDRWWITSSSVPGAVTPSPGGVPIVSTSETGTFTWKLQAANPTGPTTGTAQFNVASFPEIANQSHWLVTSSAVSDKDPTWLNSLGDFTLGPFDVVCVRWYWSHVEDSGSGTTSGTFDFDELEAMLEACAAKGKYFAPFIMWRKFGLATHSTPFGSTASVIPADLVGTYEYIDGTTVNGAMYEATVRTRYELCVKAIYDALSTHADAEYFAGVQTSETAGMISANGLTYTLSKFTTQLNTLYKNLSDYAFNYNKWFMPGWNFLTGLSPANISTTGVSAWNDVYADVRQDNVLPWTPDILPPESTRQGPHQQVFPIMEQTYSGLTTTLQQFPHISSVQNDSYDSVVNGGYTVDGLKTWGVDNLNLDVIIWTYQNFKEQKFNVPINGEDLGRGVAAALRPWDSEPDPSFAFTAPTLVDPYATIGPNGDWLTLHTSTALQVGAGGIDGITLTASGGNLTITSFNAGASTSSKAILVLSRTVLSGEVVTIDYHNPGDGLQTVATGRDLESFSRTIVNGSIQ